MGRQEEGLVAVRSLKNNPYRRPDHRTLEARAKGYPARSVFKLEEIDRRVGLLKSGQHVLDLGAAPGSWSMYASQRVGPQGRVLAMDLSEIPRSLGRNVTVMQGDCLSLSTEELATFAPYHVVLSDMAPSTVGDRQADHARSANLFLRAVDVAQALSQPGASFVGKLFMGGEFEAARARLRACYQEVKVMRPEGTRKNSVEVFLVGRGLVG